MSATVITRTTAPSYRNAVSVQEKTVAVPAHPFWSMLEENRFGFVPAVLLIIGCLGGIAAAYASARGENTLMAVALLAVLSEGLTISLASMKTIFWMTIAAIVADVIAIAV